MTRKTLYADDVTAVIESVRAPLIALAGKMREHSEYERVMRLRIGDLDKALAAIDSLPAAEPTKWEELRKYITTLGAGRSDYFDAADDCLGKMAELDGLTWEQHLEKHRQCPAAEPKLLDPDEVKAVLSKVLSSHPMAKFWAEAAINAMCGKVVGDAAAEGGEREIIDAPGAADPGGEEG